MPNRVILAPFVLTVLTVSLALVPLGLAQTGTVTTGTTATEEGQRKVKTQVAPVYPELAKRMNVGGKVKLEVVIAQDGHVKSTKAVGGHPLLVNASEDAVKKWKFQPASEETTQVMEFEFRSTE